MAVKRLLLCMLALCLLPVLALAAMRTEAVQESSDKLETLLIHFEKEIPAEVQPVFERHGWQDAQCICGAAVVRRALQRPLGQEEASRSSDALMLLEREGVRSIVGVRWTENGQSWLADYGALGLSLEQGCRIDAVKAEKPYTGYVFKLAAVLDGHICQWQLSVSGQNLWQVQTSTMDGQSFVRWNAHEGCFLLPDQSVPACVSYDLEDMDSIRDFPLTQEDALRAAQKSWQDKQAQDLAVIWGANLRTKPTAHSASLGRYLAGTLVRVITQQEGESFPWYQVKVGNTIGWVSGPYLTYACDQADFARRMCYDPLPVARMKTNALLRKELNSEKAVMRLESGMLMHVLGETDNGWLHVCVPSGGLDWQMDPAGAFGYVRKSEADVADSVLALP